MLIKPENLKLPPNVKLLLFCTVCYTELKFLNYKTGKLFEEPVRRNITCHVKICPYSGQLPFTKNHAIKNSSSSFFIFNHFLLKNFLSFFYFNLTIFCWMSDLSSAAVTWKLNHGLSSAWKLKFFCVFNTVTYIGMAHSSRDSGNNFSDNGKGG